MCRPEISNQLVDQLVGSNSLPHHGQPPNLFCSGICFIEQASQGKASDQQVALLHGQARTIS